MTITVTRYGGILPRAPKVKTVEWDELDEGAKRVLGELLNDPISTRLSPSVADGYTYTFESNRPVDAGKKVAVAGTLVPAELRKLLP
jgi:hypothetical protein